MKRVNFKKNVLAVAVVMASGYMGSAGAHWIPGEPLNPLTPTLPSTPLGADNAYDVYHSTCFTDNGGPGGTPVDPESMSNAPAARMRAQVAGAGFGTAGIFKVTVGANRTAGPGGNLQASCTDLNNNGLFPGSPVAASLPYCNNTLAANPNQNIENSAIVTPPAGLGNGEYDIVVSHPLGAGTVAGQNSAGNYNVRFHCETALGVHTGTSADSVPLGAEYLQIINY
jgi:hypothetical protein